MSYSITCRDYTQLIAAMRNRAAELKLAGETIDEIAGLPIRYTAKLFAPIPVKGLGPISLGPLLTTLGLKLIITEDAEALERVQRHYLWQASEYANVGMPTGRRRVRSAFLGNSEWGRIMRARRTVLQMPRRRSQDARAAAKARWRKPTRKD